MTGSSPDSPPPRVTVVIPTCNGREWLAGCLPALAAQTFSDFETVLVVNGSTDGTGEWVAREHPWVRCLELEHSVGFARASNLGIEAARGAYVGLLNDDTVPAPGWLEALVAALDCAPREVAAVTSKLLQLDRPELVDDAGDSLSWTGSASKSGHGEPAERWTERREVFSPSGAATLYRRSFLAELEGFDEAFHSYLEDVDLGLRGRLAGYRFIYEPTAEVLHKGQGSGLPRGAYVRLLTRNRLLLFTKSVPLRLLARHLPSLVYGQVYYLIAYRRPFHSLAGYLGYLRGLPGALAARRRILGGRRVSPATIEGLLTHGMDGPPLWELFRRRIGRAAP